MLDLACAEVPDHMDGVHTDGSCRRSGAYLGSRAPGGLMSVGVCTMCRARGRGLPLLAVWCVGLVGRRVGSWVVGRLACTDVVCC